MMLILLILIVVGIVVAIVIGYVYQREFSTKPLAPAVQVENIFSPDHNLQAIIRGRLDGTFQVEVRRRRVEETDSGPSETWALVYGPAIVASMEEAANVANQQLVQGNIQDED
jgi:hypothetical protein